MNGIDRKTSPPVVGQIGAVVGTIVGGIVGLFGAGRVKDAAALRRHVPAEDWKYERNHLERWPTTMNEGLSKISAHLLESNQENL